MQYVEALEYLDATLDSNPRDIISLLYKGKVLIALRLYNEAIEIFDFIEEVSPNYTDANDEKESLIAYLKEVGNPTRHNEPIGNNPEYSTKALIDQGLANFYRQHYDEAIHCYEMALRIIPKNIFALFYMGDAFAKQKKYEEAVASYDKALHIDVISFQELIFKGIELEKLKRYEETISCYQRAEPLISEKYRKDIQILIGNALIRMKRFDDAIAIFNKILNTYPNHSGALDGKERARYGKYDGNPVPYYR